jgi:PAS domain S-box-containing protein
MTDQPGRLPITAGALLPDDYRQLFYAFDQGFCVFEVLLDGDGRPRDYRFLEINHLFEQFTGLIDPVGRTALEMVPDLERSWIEVYGRVALTGERLRFTQESPAMGRWFDVHAARIGAPERRLVALLFNDVTAHHVEQGNRRRAEAALRQSEHRFRVFADTAPAMLWVTEADGTCSYLSRGWYHFSGQTEEEGLGYGWLEAVHPDDRDLARRTFVAANATQTPFELEHRVRHVDGTYRWVLDAGRPRFTPEGSFDGYVGSVIDIHDRKLAEDRLDLAVRSGEVGLWYCDLPFDELIWNPQVKAHFGLPEDAVVTIETFFERLHPDDRERTREAINAAIRSRTAYDVHYRTLGLDGRTRWIRAIGRAAYEGDHPVRFDGITIDVTEIVSLREAAEAANRAKDEFLAMLGHELRNPLAPILTALQLLKLRGDSTGAPERAIIERQVHHLVGLVDDLLDVSRITRGRIDLRRERLDLTDVVARAVEMASPLLEQQRHRLDVEVPRGFIIDGDPGRLAQVVANLLTNAAKYTEPGGRIHIRASALDDDVQLTVRDTGVGIDPEMLPRVFDLFVQDAQSLARSQGGLGLGLAIVRGLVELHGGSVTAASEGRHRGAEFSVRLPRAGVPAPEPRSEPPEAPPSAPDAALGRVLVVDDNRDAADLLCELLRAIGYETRAAYDGPSALAEVPGFAPHVALVDIGLPVMDGYELAQRIAVDTDGRGPRLVAVTGYGQQRDREASARAGFAAHLVKPVDIEHLREIVARLRREGTGELVPESLIPDE